MGRIKGTAKRTEGPENAESQAAVAAVDSQPSKGTKQKAEKRKVAAYKATSPRKKMKAAAATLALFSDIEDVPELPPLTVPEPTTLESSSTYVVAPESAQRSKSPVKGKDDQSDSELENPVAEFLATNNPALLKEHRGLSDELRKVSSVPFLVTNQMTIPEAQSTMRSMQQMQAVDPGRSSSFAGRGDRGETGYITEVNMRSRHEISADACEKVFECHHCRRVYFTIYSLRLHIRQQHTNTGRKIRCPHCKFVFFKLSGLRDHLSRGRCEKNRAKEEARKKALEDAERAKSSTEKDGEHSESSNQLAANLDVSGEKKPPAMNPVIANRIFEPILQRAMCFVEPKDGQSQTRVSKRHDPRNPVYKCDMCSKSFQLRDSLRRHYKQVHIYLKEDQLKTKMKSLKPPQVVYKCPVPNCQKILPTKKNFKLHYKTTHTALFNELLEQQMRELDESVLYQCPTCGKSYYLEASYLKHREECGDVEEEDVGDVDIDIDYDLLNEPWVEPKEDLAPRGRRTQPVREEEMKNADSALDTQCRYCGKLFFTIYGRIDHERKHTKGEPSTSQVVFPESKEVETVETQDEPAEESVAKLNPPGPISIRCLDCNKMFHSFEALERHHTSVHLSKAQPA